MAKVLVIGAGVAGTTAAQMLQQKGHQVTVVERAPFLGGGCKTFTYGGHPYTLGPRHFLTRREDVWNYVDRLCPMRRYEEGHEFLTYIERDNAFYHFPIHRDEVDDMPDRAQVHAEIAEAQAAGKTPMNLEEFWVFSVGPTLYSKFVDQYSRKMWDLKSNTELDTFDYTTKGVALKTGSNKAAWSEAISGFPFALDGYDGFFDVATKDCEVRLSTNIEDYDLEKHRVKIAGEWHQYDIIVSTISPEVTLKNAFGALRWMGRDFFKLVLPVKEALPKEIFFLYYANAEPFTRIVEYKKFYHYDSPTTLLGIEIPSHSNKLYPYPIKKDMAHAQQYLDAMPHNVFSIGRNACYRYMDFAASVEQCMNVFKDV